MLENSVVEKCPREVLEKSVGKGCCREVLGKSVVERKVVEKCWKKWWKGVLEKRVAEKCWRGVGEKYWREVLGKTRGRLL